jgi:hypothetical protein
MKIKIRTLSLPTGGSSCIIATFPDLLQLDDHGSKSQPLENNAVGFSDIERLQLAMMSLVLEPCREIFRGIQGRLK